MGTYNYLHYYDLFLPRVYENAITGVNQKSLNYAI